MLLFKNDRRWRLACRLSRALLGLPLLFIVPAVNAQPFLTPNNGDLLAGFRKTGANQANYEAVANIGNITNLEALGPGAQLAIGRYSPSQLSDAFNDYNNLQWSVSGSFKTFGAWAGFPYGTIWVTKPRDNFDTQSQAPGRLPAAGQTQTKQWVLGVGYGAAFISSSGLANADNTTSFVREASGDTTHDLSAYISDPNDPTLGDFNGTLNFLVENTTPASFGSPVRSDLYQLCPSGTADPITHLTSGDAYYVGFFQFNQDGTMSFTRASTNSVTTPPPPAPVLSASLAGTTLTISFSTTNGATYSLHYTNAGGLGAPLSSWPMLPTTVTGDGSIKSFSDTSTDADRVYRLSAR